MRSWQGWRWRSSACCCPGPTERSCFQVSFLFLPLLLCTLCACTGVNCPGKMLETGQGKIVFLCVDQFLQ